MKCDLAAKSCERRSSNLYPHEGGLIAGSDAISSVFGLREDMEARTKSTKELRCAICPSQRDCQAHDAAGSKLILCLQR